MNHEHRPILNGFTVGNDLFAETRKECPAPHWLKEMGRAAMHAGWIVIFLKVLHFIGG